MTGRFSRLCGFAAFCLSREVVWGELPKIGKKWWVLGPFASGKVEYEAEPRLKAE